MIPFDSFVGDLLRDIGWYEILDVDFECNLDW